VISGITIEATYGVAFTLGGAAPFLLYIERASGAYAWGVDDNRMIGYSCGHGSLLLGNESWFGGVPTPGVPDEPWPRA
jgi:hypothetical protein